MIEIWSLVFSALAAVVGIPNLIFAFFNNRARKQSELPKIHLYDTSGAFHFRLETDQHSIGWKVVRNEVAETDWEKCLAQEVYTQTDCLLSSETTEWRGHCEFPDGAAPVSPLFIHHNCGEATRSFICTTPSPIWWKPWRNQKKPVPYKFLRGTQPQGHQDPYLRNFLAR